MSTHHTRRASDSASPEAEPPPSLSLAAAVAQLDGRARVIVAALLLAVLGLPPATVQVLAARVSARADASYLAADTAPSLAMRVMRLDSAVALQGRHIAAVDSQQNQILSYARFLVCRAQEEDRGGRPAECRERVRDPLEYVQGVQPRRPP